MHITAQQQAIIDKLVGVPYEALPSPMDLDPPWRAIFGRVRRAGSYGRAHSLIWKAVEGLENPLTLAKDLIDLLPHEDRFTLVPSLWEMSGEFPPVDWLWPSWIPRGLLTLFGAAPGTGKSLVALDLARRIIQGEPFPDGAPVPCPGSNVLFVDAEGAPALFSQRVRAWDIDPRRLFLMPGFDPAAVGYGDAAGSAAATSCGPATSRGAMIDLAHPAHQYLFNEICRSVKPALVIVDSLSAASSRGETSLAAARNLLGFLSSVAERYHLALLVIHHLRKRTRSGQSPTEPRVAADDLRGSSHLSPAARSVLALSLVADPTSSSPRPRVSPSPPPPASQRRFEVVKTNLCRHPPPLCLIFEGENVPVPTLRYVPLVEPPPLPTQAELCARWLLDYLAAAGAPVKPGDAVRAAADVGFGRTTVYRTRQALAGLVHDVGTGPHDPFKLWALPPTGGSSSDLDGPP